MLHAYSRYFGPQTVMQNNPDKYNCRKGNVFDGVENSFLPTPYKANSYLYTCFWIFCLLMSELRSNNTERTEIICG
jgi:hypothetical protein